MELLTLVEELKTSLLLKKEEGRPISPELRTLEKNPDIKNYLLDKYYPVTHSHQLLYHLVSGTEPQMCICGKIKKFTNYSKGYKSTCNDICCVNTVRLESIKKTTIEKYGVEHHSQVPSLKEKTRALYKEKTGYEHPWQNPKIREKTAKTQKEKTGYEYPLQNPEAKEKRKNTILDSGRSLNFLHSDKAKSTNMKRYGVENASKNEEIILKITGTQQEHKREIASTKLAEYNISIDSYEPDKQYYNLYCSNCSTSFVAAGSSLNSRLRSNFNPCPCCNPPTINYTSNKENELGLYIESLHDHILRNVRTAIKKNELDIYIPTMGIAFEFNGVYWHSELYKDAYYHIDKTLLGLDNNIKIFHIWEDIWDLKKEIVKSMINHIFNFTDRIYARKCVIRPIDNKVAKKFCDNNHIHGGINAKYRLGLFYNDELVSVMSFSKARFSNDSWEIIRYCTKLNNTVVGGASKLFSYFLQHINPDKVVSFCEIDISPAPEDAVYNKLGFKLIGKTPPTPGWVIEGVRQNRMKYMKHKLVEQGFNKNKAAVDIMLERGYYRAFNCGHWKFEWEKTILSF